jgi:hypothetical protein
MDSDRGGNKHKRAKYSMKFRPRGIGQYQVVLVQILTEPIWPDPGFFEYGAEAFPTDS